MPGYSLHHLDQRTVAVEFPIAQQKRVVRGQGRIVSGDRSGTAALHICVDEFAEQFEIVFDLERFSGLIEHGERFACDFAIRLDDGNPFLAGASGHCHGPMERSAAA